MPHHLIGQPKASLDTPALIVDLDVMERNIRTMADTIIRDAGVQWRPHTKAMKSPAIARKLMDAGAHGVTCAKLGEAEAMAAGGIDHILIANQIVGQQKIDRLVALRRHTDVICAVDNLENVEMMDRAGIKADVPLSVVIEIDVGMQRAGVAPGEKTVELARRIAGRRGVQLAGLMAWEAHTLRFTDENEKRQAIREALEQVAATAQACRDEGIPIGIVSCGGTGTYWLTARCPGVTEIQAGGGVYCDVLYRTRFGVRHDYALTILSTVTSRPTPDRVICDAGKKTMSSDGATPEPLGLPPIKSVGLSAEHGTLRLEEPGDTPRLGDKIEFIVGYSDTTVVLHDVMYAVRGGVIEEVWELTGRGKLQ
ncbi:MAG: DSD1 family PLP-dependent enzyme [Candidatus Poribacteria bacterium]|nr:DSD1 family PLP-dependent enzyme [Candidatus Poribacteria bacterium]